MALINKVVIQMKPIFALKLATTLAFRSQLKIKVKLAIWIFLNTIVWKCNTEILTYHIWDKWLNKLLNYFNYDNFANNFANTFLWYTQTFKRKIGAYNKEIAEQKKGSWPIQYWVLLVFSQVKPTRGDFFFSKHNNICQLRNCYFYFLAHITSKRTFFTFI